MTRERLLATDDRRRGRRRRRRGARRWSMRRWHRIAARNPVLNAFTDVTAERARAARQRVDAARATGEARAAGRRAVRGEEPVRRGRPADPAGSKINRDDRRPLRDATLVARLEAAGAILVGALNMGEYAYDFTGENAHDGPSRNPHDLAHMTGGSSGGSGGAVAGGLVPIALGSDTNGSIRVPASFCGVFGLKPTYGRLSRAGSFPFVASLDHLGPLARSVADLARAYDAMQGPDPADPAACDRPAEPVAGMLDAASAGLRIAAARRLFSRAVRRRRRCAAVDARRRGAAASTATVELPEAAIGRARRPMSSPRPRARRCISTGCAPAPDDFDPDVRDRLIAGAMLPGAVVVAGAEVPPLVPRARRGCSTTVDAILAPATPCARRRSARRPSCWTAQEMLVRPNIGIYTQPISFIGLPVVAVPVSTAGGHADRRADHRAAVARGRRVAYRAISGSERHSGRATPAAGVMAVTPAG